jgi:hypothetical protein
VAGQAVRRVGDLQLWIYRCKGWNFESLPVEMRVGRLGVSMGVRGEP